MGTRKSLVIWLFLGVLVVAFSGCATTDQQARWAKYEEQRKSKIEYPYWPLSGEKGMTAEDYKKELDAKARLLREAEERARQAQLAKEEAERRAREAMLAKERAEKDAYCPPLTAKIGECYASVYVPPKFRTVTEKVLVKQASERIETIPAKYEVVEQKVLVKEASVRYEEVPAEYGWVEEKVLVEPAHTVWKKGRGLIEKVDTITGEILCLVEVPARYETVRKQVVVKPATIRRVEIPAEYETIKVTKMVSPPQEKRIPIPAEYGTVTRTEKVSDGYMACKPVLCETNISPKIVIRIQEALSKAGFSPGPVDGVLGEQTRAAIVSYQKAKGLAQGDLTYETLESLGVKID